MNEILKNLEFLLSKNENNMKIDGELAKLLIKYKNLTRNLLILIFIFTIVFSILFLCPISGKISQPLTLVSSFIFIFFVIDFITTKVALSSKELKKIKKYNIQKISQNKVLLSKKSKIKKS